MVTRESECVAMKRRGAEHVAQQLSGKTLPEQLDFWQRRTEALLATQTKLAKQTKPIPSVGTA